MPPLQFNGKLRIRQYLISDPPIIYYTECYTYIKDWQQQTTITPSNLQNLDPQSDRRHYHTATLRPPPLVDNYNPPYRDPDFGFDPYWDIHIYNQHQLHFYNEYT